MNLKSLRLSHLASACAAVALGVSASAWAGPVNTWQNSGWMATSEIVGQTSTATVAGGGNPLYIPPAGAYTGTVGILMNYGAAGSFVCSGSLIGARSVLTAAHCVSDGTAARPISTTVFFNRGLSDVIVYNGGAGVDQVAVQNIVVNSKYSGQVVDSNDIAVLQLDSDAPSYASIYGLSGLTDLTGVNHTIAGYGARSATGGSSGTLGTAGLGTGRLRYAGNRFDFRFGDADFQGYWDGAFGSQDVNDVWISDFDNGTAARDGSCNVGLFEGPNAPGIFSNPIFSSSKYCDRGIGDFEGIGAGGDSGAGYIVDGQIAAVHSFALWQQADESANRFGQLKGAVPVYAHLDFIRSAMGVPEPGTLALVLAAAGFAGVARRRSTSAA